jgi:hypothetical protein
MTTIKTEHPDYVEYKSEWHDMRTTDRGEKAVKEAGTDYLPMPSGFTIQPDAGLGYYEAYRTRAQFPEIVSHTLSGMVGVIHKRESTIEMPNSMQYLWERASKRGLTLEALHRRITAEVLLMGRNVLLATAPPEGGDPYLVGYKAEALINWSEEQDFFVLDETSLVRDGYEWGEVPRYRVLEVVNGEYRSSLYDENEALQGNISVPRAIGDRAIGQIPLTVIGSKDLHVDPEKPPLIGVSRAALAAYRLDADYRHQLYNSGQETLFITGVDSTTELPRAVGAGVVHGLPKDCKAEYVGPSARTIEAHRTAILDERQNAAQAGARLFDTEPTQRVSGEALKFRDAARNATLASVAIAVGAGLERALRNIAIYLNERPESVVVKPNLEFVDRILTAQEAFALVQGWQAKAFSYLTLYENLRKGGIASEERDVEQELAEIAKNPPPEPPVTGGGNGSSNQDV